MTREEALDIVRGLDSLTSIKKEALEMLIPELKIEENKNERMKKAIINALNSYYISNDVFDGFSKNDMIKWLEDLVPPKWLYRLEYKDGTCGLWYNGEGKWCFEQGIGSLIGCKTKNLPMDHDERYKQDGRDWFSSCSNKEDLLHWYSLDDAEELIRKGFVFTRYLATEYHEYENETVFIKDSSLVREEIDIFELFGKTKPMFKEGDWIVDGLDSVFQIKEIKENKYFLQFYNSHDVISTKIYTIDNDCHLWTLQDAKPGDVLVAQYTTFIFKGLKPKGKDDLVEYFVTTDKVDGSLLIGPDEYMVKDCEPANKSQRDHLFGKIKKAGYYWDEKAKKLVNSSLKEKEEIDTGFTKMNETKGWSEEDKENYKEILTHLECQGNSATLDINRKNWRKLESWFKRRVPALSELGWTEEDKKNSTYICAALDCYYRLRENKHNDYGQEELDIARNWLYKRLEKIRPYGSTEEDKKMIDNIISDLRELRNNETNEELISDYEREIEWLRRKMYERV